MKTRKMPWFEFAPDTYEIDEFDCASIFLFVGTERALLLDTGIGIGDLKGLVEEITDKPYDVVLTHGHRDHTGGAGWFDTVYQSSRKSIHSMRSLIWMSLSQDLTPMDGQR